MVISGQAGRTRLVVTVVLVAAIGTAGAFLVPRLIHEAAAPLAAGEAHVCVEVTENGLKAGETIRLEAKTPSEPEVDVRYALPASPSADAILRGLAKALELAGWRLPQPSEETSGPCLRLGPATSVGGDPGLTGAVLSFGLSAAPAKALALELACRSGPESDGVTGVRIRLGFTAWSPGDEGGRDATASEVFLDAAWVNAAAVRTALEKRLETSGWEVEARPPNVLVVHRLPDGNAIGSALFTVGYTPEEGAVEAPTPTVLWSLTALPPSAKPEAIVPGTTPSK